MSWNPSMSPKEVINFIVTYPNLSTLNLSPVSLTMEDLLSILSNTPPMLERLYLNNRVIFFMI